ncbi:unnamed protein product [Lampetra fluviatilis]
MPAPVPNAHAGPVGTRLLDNRRIRVPGRPDSQMEASRVSQASRPPPHQARGGPRPRKPPIVLADGPSLVPSHREVRIARADPREDLSSAGVWPPLCPITGGELASVGHLQQGLHREAHLGQALLFQNVMRGHDFMNAEGARLSAAASAASRCGRERRAFPSSTRGPTFPGKR